MFSQNLKRIRLERGLSQKQVAEAIDTSQQAYARWESEKFSPNLKSIEKLANFFDLSIEELLTDGTTSIENLLNAETITYQGKILSTEDTSKIKEALKIILSKID